MTTAQHRRYLSSALVIAATLFAVSSAHAEDPPVPSGPAVSQFRYDRDLEGRFYKGVTPLPSDKAPAQEREDSVPKNPAMMTAGIVISGIGVLSGIVGVSLGLFKGGFGRACGAGAPEDEGVYAGVGFGLIGLSGLSAIVGIPLWAVGASDSEPPKASAAPTVAVGAGSATLTWSF